MGYLLFFNRYFLQGSQHRTTSQEEKEEGHEAQHAQEGQHTTDATQALLLAIGQLLREQHQNQTVPPHAVSSGTVRCAWL